MDIVQDIKDRLSIEDVVSQYVQLKKVGRSFKALCPFHQEKTPSFIVSPEKGLAYCFGCHKGGDVFRFIQEVEGVEFAEAIKILAEKTGLSPDLYVSHAPKMKKEQKEILYDIHEEATSFFESQLWETEEGKKVLDYLRKRGLVEETIRRFRLGFAPDGGEVLQTFLIKKGFHKKDLIFSGLVSVRETHAEHTYDRFRLRLVFPITDVNGRVIAFGGRALKKDAEPKYLNSPESTLYHKGRVLYGLSEAKKYIKESDSAVIVEGYMDALLSYQANVRNVAASSGTALTADQVKLIKKFTKHLIFSFDNDEAGFDASVRGYLVSMEQEMDVRIVTIPEGKDPADSVKADPKLFQEAVTKGKTFLQFYFDILLRKFSATTAEGVKGMLDQALPFIKKIQSPVVKDFYIRELALRLRVSESQLYDEMKRTSLSELHPARQMSVSNSTKKFNIEDYFFALLLEFPAYVPDVSSELGEDDFEETYRDIYKWLLQQYNSGRRQAGELQCEGESDEFRERVQFLSLVGEERYGSAGSEFLKEEVGKLVDRIKKLRSKSRHGKLKAEIRQAEIRGDKDQAKRLLGELQHFL